MYKNFVKIGLLFILSFAVFSCNNKDEIQEIDINEKAPSKIREDATINPKLVVAISTMISPVETFNLYKDLIDYISKKMGVAIEFKQRKTYGEVNDLLEKKQLDFAFICTGAYWEAKKKFPLEILVVPVVNGKPTYQSYIIVNKESGINSFDELEGKSFAFTDPLSNSGFKYVDGLMRNKKLNIDNFFSKTIYTYAHDYSIQAVSRKIVDAASVDGLVYEYLENFQPEKIKNVVVIQKSKDFAIPLFVVRPSLDTKVKNKLKNIMLNMSNDPEGKVILKKIMIDKFIEGDEKDYVIPD